MATLEQRINAQNEVNIVIAENLKVLVPQLEEMIDKKLCLADGSLTKTAKKQIKFSDYKPNEFNGDYVNIYRLALKKQGYSLVLSVEICAKDNGFSCFYTPRTAYFGTINDEGKLVELNKNFVNQLTNPKIYNVNKVKQTREEIENLKELITTLESEISPFTGRY